MARVACGSSHSVAWTAPDPPLPAATEPVMFTTTKDPLGAHALGQFPHGKSAMIHSTEWRETSVVYNETMT